MGKTAIQAIFGLIYLFFYLFKFKECRHDFLRYMPHFLLMSLLLAYAFIQGLYFFVIPLVSAYILFQNYKNKILEDEFRKTEPNFDVNVFLWRTVLGDAIRMTMVFFWPSLILYGFLLIQIYGGYLGEYLPFKCEVLVNNKWFIDLYHLWPIWGQYMLLLGSYSAIPNSSQELMMNITNPSAVLMVNMDLLRLAVVYQMLFLLYFSIQLVVVYIFNFYGMRNIFYISRANLKSNFKESNITACIQLCFVFFLFMILPHVILSEGAIDNGRINWLLDQIMLTIIPFLVQGLLFPFILYRNFGYDLISDLAEIKRFDEEVSGR